MKLDVGVGFRALVKGLVVRVDVAASEEEVGVQMMVGHRASRPTPLAYCFAPTPGVSRNTSSRVAP